MKARWTSLLVAPLALALGVFFFVVPRVVGARMNAVRAGAFAPPSAAAVRLHDTLFVADLHADTLLWNRDLLARGTWGHVDVPRLIDGGVALQAFTIVTKTPRGQNIDRNDAASDNITLLALAQRWPPATWTSLTARALYQARRLHEAADRSGGRLRVIGTRGDLDAYVAARRTTHGITAGWLGIEGAHALGGSLTNLDRLYDAGVRMMAPTHFFDTDIGGSAHGQVRGGLTPMGRDWVRRMEATHMIVDLAHASPATIRDVLAIATRPVFVSHTGVRATCDNVRNLDDDTLRRIAATGGVIGIGFWDTAVCAPMPAAVARAVRHAVSVAGIDHVGLGSDFDGAVETGFDAAGMVRVTDALLAAGFANEDIRKIMGNNVVRVLGATLPER